MVLRKRCGCISPLTFGPATALFCASTHMSRQVLTLLYGGGFHLVNPANEGIKSDREEYELAV
jgi:hypothetical protein